MSSIEEIPGLGDKIKELMDKFGFKRCKAFVIACKMLGMGKNSTCQGRQETLNDRSRSVARAKAIIAAKTRKTVSEKV